MSWDSVPSKAERRKMSPERRKIWARIDDEIAEEKSCPNFAEHTDRALGMPDGYMAREAWWREMKKTHSQRKCRGCHRYAIWKPRTRR